MLHGWEPSAAESAARAVQLRHALHQLTQLKLPGGGGAGPRDHLVRLAPAMIQCIGRSSGPELPEGPEACELQGAIRDALAVAWECATAPRGAAGRERAVGGVATSSGKR